MKKKNIFSKLWLKHTDTKAYKEYRWMLNNYKDVDFKRFLLATRHASNFAQIKEFAAANKTINFNHSGNAGDIIYALPTLAQVREITGADINLYFTLGRPIKVADPDKHPLGGVMLNQKMIDMLIPLIKAQPYINECEAGVEQDIHVDLDYFRSGLIPQDKGNITHWCGYITGVNPVLWKKWLTVEADTTYKDSIIIARSERYRNPLINYQFLSKYHDLVFIGVEAEYNDIIKVIPNIKWVQVSDFLQMAQIIAGCKLFIGNQSFPYSIAEALKVPRILEVSFEVINVVPEGESGHDFFFQDHFEWLAERLGQ